MVWNYRIVEKDGRVGIHEVYYHEDGSTDVTVEIMKPWGWDVEELKYDWDLMALAFKKPVLKYEEIGNNDRKSN